MDNTELIYLYCITDKTPDLQEVDKLSENIFSINSNELYAVAKYVPEEEIERLGETLMKLENKMDELKEIFGLKDEDLNLNLGPLGDLM